MLKSKLICKWVRKSYAEQTGQVTCEPNIYHQHNIRHDKTRKFMRLSTYL